MNARRSPQRPSRARPFFTKTSALTAGILLALVTVACGKKGPPLPPLVKLPIAPADFTAARRANTVDLQFTIPNQNTDSSRPANVARVDVYGYTGLASVSDLVVLKQGSRVASISVKAPRDPDATFDPGDPDQSEADVNPPEGEGVDQGSVAHIQETLVPEAPVAGTDTVPPVRTYIGVSITTRGRRGQLSRRAAVPLVPPPVAPEGAEATYTETAVQVTWAAVPSAEEGAITYNVYEMTERSETRLTAKPVADAPYLDSRMTWGAKRCYHVRSLAVVAALPVESEPSPPACVSLVDHFPPAAPTGLQAVATEGVISLIWDANTEPDFDGYILLRGPAPGDELSPITTALIRDTAFQDRVTSGQRYVYAVRAVDRAGNLSQMSERTEETAR